MRAPLVGPASSASRTRSTSAPPCLTTSGSAAESAGAAHAGDRRTARLLATSRRPSAAFSFPSLREELTLTPDGRYDLLRLASGPSQVAALCDARTGAG
jgi:hypothetical protein